MKNIITLLLIILFNNNLKSQNDCSEIFISEIFIEKAVGPTS